MKKEIDTSNISIPFNEPHLAGNELTYIQDAIERGQLAGDGYYTHQCQHLLENHMGGGKALLTHSCTGALEMAAILLNIQLGDEVIMPSYTFVSTANAFILRGATPVFVDITPTTLCISADTIAPAITPRTRAICVVHYAGVCCDMDPILKLAEMHHLPVIEDAAQALGSKYKGKAAGSLGALGCFSFHETKNAISGEGGALIVNDPVFSDRADTIREKGTNRKQFFQGTVDKYTWVDIGSSYLPGELVSAFLFAQLECLDKLNADRMAAWNLYYEAFSDFKRHGVILPSPPTYCEHNAHLFYLILPTPEIRTTFIAHMKNNHVLTPFHYVPLHSAPAGKRYGQAYFPMENTEQLSARLVRMPLFPKIADKQERIINTASRILRQLL